MTISSQKFLQSSSDRNSELLSNFLSVGKELLKREKELEGKEKRITAENMRLISQMSASNQNVQVFYQRGYMEGYQKAYAEGFKFAQKQFQPQQQGLIDIIRNIQRREDGGDLNKGDISIVGEKGPEVMVAKQDVNIVANKDVKFIPPSSKPRMPTTTIVRTIIQKQGTKIVNRTKIM